MSFYVACQAGDCTENGVPKLTDDVFRDAFEQGVIVCGACGEAITAEVPAPPEPPDLVS